MEELKFGIGLWSVGFTADRFIPEGYRPRESFEKQIELISKIPDAEFVQINYPSNFVDLSAKNVLGIVEQKNIRIDAINTDLFGANFKYGAFTNQDKKIRRKAIDLVKKAADIAHELNCKSIEMWPG